MAAYCAWDIKAILSPSLTVSMYSLAAPRCAVGFTVDTIAVPVASFLQGYQGVVPNSFRIVHTCDLIPHSLALFSYYKQLAERAIAQVSDGQLLTAPGE